MPLFCSGSLVIRFVALLIWVLFHPHEKHIPGSVFVVNTLSDSKPTFVGPYRQTKKSRILKLQKNDEKQHQTQPDQQQVYSLLTWNILAPIYAPYHKYSHCEAQFVNWTYRKQQIIQTIQISSPDIVCLQEVQIDQWNNKDTRAAQSTVLQATAEEGGTNEQIYDFHPIAVRGEAYDRHESNTVANYTVVLQNVTGGHPVACAVLVNPTKFRVYRTESRSRALIVVLEPLLSHYSDKEQNKKNLSPLFLVNCHLEAGREKDEKRYYQIRSLLKRVEYHVNDYYKKKIKPVNISYLQTINDTDIESEKMLWIKNPFLIVAGDLNSAIAKNRRIKTAKSFGVLSHRAKDYKNTDNIVKDNVKNFNNQQQPSCAIYHLFSTGHILQSLERAISANKKENLMLPFLPLHDIYQATKSPFYYCGLDSLATVQRSSTTLIEHVERSSTTISNISTAQSRKRFYSTQPHQDLLIGRTFSSGAVLDYIWASNRFYRTYTTTKTTGNDDDGTIATQTKGTENKRIVPWVPFESKTMQEGRSSWPSRDIPSDHLPIGAKFRLL